jgi:hypothetical protein
LLDVSILLKSFYILGCPSESELNEMAQKLTNEWKPLGRLLLSNNEVDIIDADEGGVVEKTVAMLNKWRRRNTRDATYGQLYTALVNGTVNRGDIAEEYCTRQDTEL